MRVTGGRFHDFEFRIAVGHRGRQRVAVRFPSGFTPRAAPTPYVWIIGRTKTDGPSDCDAVHKIQAGDKVTPLSRLLVDHALRQRWLSGCRRAQPIRGEQLHAIQNQR
jgi:hypothetical protein